VDKLVAHVQSNWKKYAVGAAALYLGRNPDEVAAVLTAVKALLGV